MTPRAAYENTLLKRLTRLNRVASYKQDGHGTDLSDEALVLVYRCIDATRADWIESLRITA